MRSASFCAFVGAHYPALVSLTMLTSDLMPGARFLFEYDDLHQYVFVLLFIVSAAKIYSCPTAIVASKLYLRKHILGWVTKKI